MEADTLIPALLRAGIVSVEEAVAEGVLAEPIGLSHPVWRVTVGGKPRAVIKAFGPRRGESDGEYAREQAVLALAAARPGVAALVPRLLDWPGSEVIATAPAPGASAFVEADALNLWPRLVAALAAPLAAFHRATRDVAAPGAEPHPVLDGPEPWALRLFDGDGPAEIWATPALGGLLQAVAAEPGFVPLVRRSRGAWRKLCVVHADLKQDNILLDLAADPPRATVVDWEMARLGDPAWDLAGPFSRLLLASPEQPWIPANEASLAAWIAAYGAAAKLAPPALVQRTALYAGVWMLMAALQQGSVTPADRLLATVRPTLAGAIAALVGAEAATARVLASLP